MNLIQDAWIPVVRADGSKCKIAPWEIGANANPVVKIAAPRPDFRGALHQFLIGIVQTAFMPEDVDDWVELWNTPPSCEELESAFVKYKEAFELFNENGPAFMQDFNLPAKAEYANIRSLLIDAPGESTIKKNLDHFVKRAMVDQLCNSCTASALFTLQANAPSGGQGHRTGMRGGGPLTTLVVPDKELSTLWEIIWLNILPGEDYFRTMPDEVSPDVFPWTGPTRESSNNKETHPHQVHALQLYWGMPRRIRLGHMVEHGSCSICGESGSVWTDYRTVNYGTNYSAAWQHTLSPYRKQEEKDGTTSLIATKGKQGGFSYPDWLNLTLVPDPEKAEAAAVVKFFMGKKLWHVSDSGYRIWCSGYDMDNMKARCWYDQTMPVFTLPEELKGIFIDEVQKLINAAGDASRILHERVKAAWFEHPKDVKGDTSFIIASFWEETETQFFAIVHGIRKAVLSTKETVPLLEEWRRIIIRSAEKLFDRFAVQDTDEIKNMKRVAEAAQALENILHSPNTKSIAALKEVV